MNHCGEMARQHWQRYRPVEYQAMTDPDAFFTDLGEQISAWITELTPDFEGTPPPGETFPDKIGRLNFARLTAEEQVLREMLPQSEAENQEQPEEQADQGEPIETE
jgi:hypothetical protein